MKMIPRPLSLLAALTFAATPAAHAQLTVENVRATQRTGTKLVDVDYNIGGIATPVSVSLEISADGGTTWAVPAITASGAIGGSVTPGTNLRITWDAGADWNTQTSAQTRFRLKVDDLSTNPADFALIPKGSFSMGSTDGDSTELPIHTVQVSAFYMAKYETTKALWDVVREWGMAHGYTDLASGVSKEKDHPVQTVTWFDVVKWCNARSEKEGLTPCYYTDVAQTVVLRTGDRVADNPQARWSANGYRLPTEAEWEKGARGGLSGKRFPWGDTISHSEANYYGTGEGNYDLSWGSHPNYPGIPGTSPVGSFAANGYGLYDMAGNVFEWCWDWYGSDYYKSSPAIDPRGATTVSRCVTRGGAWEHGANNSRVAYRTSEGTGYAFYHIGFRTVRVPIVAAESPNLTVDTSGWVISLNAIHGTVSGAGQYVPNTMATLTATPAPGYLFANWTGDATGTDNPLFVLMDADLTVTANFTPDTNDDDSDGLTNYQEIVEYGTDPAKADTDGDGAKDGADAFPLDPAETLDTDADGTGDNADTDDDGDGLPDADEIGIYGTDPKSADSDGDGLTDRDELQVHHTDPNLADTDSDGLTDGPEVLTYGANPKVADTDKDGFLDGYEVLTGKLPLDPLDIPALVAEARTAIEFTFPAALGKTYRIEGSLDLSTWVPVEEGIAGNGEVIQRFYSTRDMPKRYLRVEEVTGP